MPILAQLTSPVDGLVAQEEFLSIAAARKWIDRRMMPYTVSEAEQETLRERREAEEWEARRPPKEERELKARAVQLEARETIGKRPPAIQAHNPSKLLEALENLEAMKRMEQPE
jgi:hypothetical protein